VNSPDSNGPDVPVAIVTGGTKGIGRAIVERLDDDGWDIVATYAHDEDAASALTAARPNVAVRRRDVSSTNDCLATVSDAIDRFGALDHVIACAATTGRSPLAETTDEEWDEVIAANLSGTFRLARAAIPALATSPRGRIIAVSSVAATMGNAGQGSYAASKSGLVGLTKTLARELARSGTTVNLVIPGPTADTSMTSGTDDAFVDAIVRKTPDGRLARPEEIAFAVRFFLDDLAAHVTGTSVTVDGGLSM